MCHECWQNARNVPSLADRISDQIMRYDNAVYGLEKVLDDLHRGDLLMIIGGVVVDANEINTLILKLSDSKKYMTKRRNRFIDWFECQISLEELLTPSNDDENGGEMRRAPIS